MNRMNRSDRGVTAGRGWLAAVLLPALLSACVSVPSTRGDGRVLACAPAATDAACASRIAALQAQAPVDAAWQFQGRAALSGGGQGGNARIDWDHQPAQDVVVLSAPVTRQSWRLEVTPAGASVHGMAGGVRSDVDAQRLLAEATGWQIPVPLLRHWVLGNTAPQVPVAQYRFALDGAAVEAAAEAAVEAGAGSGLAGFDQAGWRIDIAERDASGRPLRLNAEQPGQGHRVRLVIDHWGAPEP